MALTEKWSLTRWASGGSRPRCSTYRFRSATTVSLKKMLAALDKLFEGAARVAMIIEPVQGEGGFYPAPPTFLQALRRICDEHGLVIRRLRSRPASGARQAVCHRARGGGARPYAGRQEPGRRLPVIRRQGRDYRFGEPGGLGGTYAGRRSARAAGLAVLDVIDKERLCKKRWRSVSRYGVGRVISRRRA